MLIDFIQLTFIAMDMMSFSRTSWSSCLQSGVCSDFTLMSPVGKSREEGYEALVVVRSKLILAQVVLPRGRLTYVMCDANIPLAGGGKNQTFMT